MLVLVHLLLSPSPLSYCCRASLHDMEQAGASGVRTIPGAGVLVGGLLRVRSLVSGWAAGLVEEEDTAPASSPPSSPLAAHSSGQQGCHGMSDG